MIHNAKTFLRPSLIFVAGLFLSSSLSSCNGKKTEQQTVSSTIDSTRGVLGREGDTTGSNPTMDQQAPPDSAQMSGPTVIEDVKVIKKK